MAKKKAAKKKVSFAPKGYHTATPFLHVADTRAAIAFYVKAFGAKQVALMTGPGGSVMHAEIRIGDSHIMMGDANPDMGMASPDTLGGSAGGVMLYVPNVDKVWAAAVAAGATVLMPLDIVGLPFAAPAADAPLGTDYLGRDVLAAVRTADE